MTTLDSAPPLLLLAGGAIIGACATYALYQGNTKRCNGAPICLLVTVEIKPELVADFLKAIEIDAVGSRNEPGCLRFDVLQDKSQSNKFTFYETYISADAIVFHKVPSFFPINVYM
jgi:hypothetical protein